MQFDVTIIGGGMVGAALACALRNNHFSVALIDDSPLDIAEDARLIALNYTSVCLFERIGIWPDLIALAAPIEQIHVSQRGRFGMTRLTAKEMKLHALGYVVPAKYINQALYSQMNSAENITLLRPATLQELTYEEDVITLAITTAMGRRNFSTHKLVGADGSHSSVREFLNIPTKKVDYQQSALVTVTELQRPHQNIAYERFQDQGAIAMLPLMGQRAATIWTAANDTILYLQQLEDAAFLAELQKQFGYRLGRLKQSGKRAVYPLQMVLAEQQVIKNCVLIGNAAHTLHPIASQGLNLALYEVNVLVEDLLQDQPFSLDKIKKQRNFSQALSHRLAWLFSTDFFMLNTLRQVGMLSLDNCSFLKKRFMQFAMGMK